MLSAVGLNDKLVHLVVKYTKAAAQKTTRIISNWVETCFEY